MVSGIHDNDISKINDDDASQTAWATPPELSIVIPVYQSATVLQTLMDRIVSVLDKLRISYEVIFVEDGSGDNSWEVLQKLCEKYSKNLIAIQLTRNFGQHNALMCGFRYTRGKLVLTMDDDLQNPPEEIPKLLDTIRNTSFDVVYGVPMEQKQNHGRNAGSLLVRSFYRIVFSSNVNIHSFRLIRQEIIQSLLKYDLSFIFLDGLLAWHTKRIGSVEVEHSKRKEGHSGYGLGKLVTLALNLFTNFSLIPLQAVGFAGFVFAICGLLGGTYFLFRSLAGGIGVPGYASIIVAIMVLGGIQLLSLGIIGEYLGRVHLNLNGKPQYTVRTILGHRRLVKQ